MERGPLSAEPSIPDELKTAARAGKLVIFVGAGVSRLSGGPSWQELAQGSLCHLADNNIINHARKSLLSSLDPRTVLSIVKRLCEKNKEDPPYKGILSNQPHSRPSDIYERLYSIGCVFVTTNYDTMLDRQASLGASTVSSRKYEAGDVADASRDSATRTTKGDIVTGRSNLTIEKLYKPGTIVHLHGSIQNPGSMVVTTRDYLEHYSDLLVVTFLERLFQEFTVLFIGYSLEEEDILQYVIRKRSPASNRHYRLLPLFEYQAGMLDDLSDYYSHNCNITIVPFRRDELDHIQLEAVVRKWGAELSSCVQEPGFLEKARLIREAPL